MDPWFQHYMLSFNPSEKYDIVSWDDDIPNIWEKKVPNHQPVLVGMSPN